PSGTVWGSFWSRSELFHGRISNKDACEERTMKNFNSKRLAVLVLAAVALLSTAAIAQEAKQEKPAAPPPITIAQLAGPWQIAIVGNTGCGVNSMLFNGKLSTTGVATGTLVGSSAGCGSSTTTETFTIISLKPNGSGTAGLTCGAGCGW